MRKTSLAAASVAAATAAAMCIAGPAQAQSANPHVVPNTKPAWTAKATKLGAAAAQAQVNARVYLAPRGGAAALAAAATAVSTPGSTSYHKFLTSAQYTAKYGVTSQLVAGVQKYLETAGLTVTGVGASNSYVSVTGTVKAAQQAFGTTLDTYNHDGRTVQAPSTDVTVPDSVASSILTVTGLDTTPNTIRPASAQIAPPAGFRNAAPCSVYYGQLSAAKQADYTTPLPKFNGKTLSYAPCGYTGPQLRSAYEPGVTQTGKGVTVGILDAYASPTMAVDANNYATRHGDGSYVKGQYTETVAQPFTNETACAASGWFGEEALDVEAVHAMAPQANIHFYGAASCEDSDFLNSMQTIVDQDAVDLVSNSWGEVESGESADAVAAYEKIFQQGALEGISFLFSAGDNGDEQASSGVLQADYPASDPYVTTVGGTSTGIGSGGSISFQTGWGTHKWTLASDGKSWTQVGYVYGSGGGSSALFNEPAYQVGVVPGPRREYPDVAMDADPTTGMLIGLTQSFPTGNAYGEYRIGGTSLASPLFAGFTALGLQKSGRGAGLLNPLVYANTKSFSDVKGTPPTAGAVRIDYANGLDASGGLLYTVRTFNQDSSLSIAKGWDDVTGVGVPTPKWIATLGS